jgi:hypothetical protein
MFPLAALRVSILFSHYEQNKFALPYLDLTREMRRVTIHAMQPIKDASHLYEVERRACQLSALDSELRGFNSPRHRPGLR